MSKDMKFITYEEANARYESDEKIKENARNFRIIYSRHFNKPWLSPWVPDSHCLYQGRSIIKKGFFGKKYIEETYYTFEKVFRDFVMKNEIFSEEDTFKLIKEAYIDSDDETKLHVINPKNKQSVILIGHRHYNIFID